MAFEVRHRQGGHAFAPSGCCLSCATRECPGRPWTHHLLRRQTTS